MGYASQLSRMYTALEILLILAVGAVLYEIARILGLLGKSLRMTRSIRPFEQRPANPTVRILLVGDSTGYGTGTTDSRFSITGRIAAEFPGAHVENWSETGSRLKYIARKLRKHPVAAQPFDLVIIMAGGMSVVHQRSMTTIKGQLEQVVMQARRHGRGVMLVAPHNAGRVPMFRPPLSWRNEKRAQAVDRLFAEVSAEQHIPLASLIHTNDVLAARGLYSKDKTHPVDEGYGLWYQEMQPIIHELLHRHSHE